MHDILVNTRNRWPAADFEIREVAVQGVSAVPEVTQALTELDSLGLDVIVIARGGGSLEDLLPFSNETLIRAVSRASTPIVSAIGHEQDSPLLDFVADLRASTPTDAAKKIVPSLKEEQLLIEELRQRTTRAVNAQLDIHSIKIRETRKRLQQIVIHLLDSEARTIGHLRTQVRSLSPAATMERGYSIVLTAAGEIVREETQVAIGGIMDIRIAHGRLRALRVEPHQAEEGSNA